MLCLIIVLIQRELINSSEIIRREVGGVEGECGVRRCEHEGEPSRPGRRCLLTVEGVSGNLQAHSEERTAVLQQ